MTYIVKADIPFCKGEDCHLCENYLPDFFKKNGGIIVVDTQYEIDGAELAEQFCPNQCISMEVVRDVY